MTSDALSQTTGRADAAPRGGGALAGLSLAMLLSTLGLSSASVALPSLVSAFDASFQAVQWVVVAYLLSLTALSVVAGRIGDLAGRRRVLISGIVIFTVASALCAAAPTLWVLIIARLAQGAGAAVMMALALASVGDIVPTERTGRVMGLLGTTSAIGTALGPSLGGGLITLAGWPAIFLINLPLGIAAVWLVRRALPAQRNEDGIVDGRFDRAGVALLTVALGTYALAVTVNGHAPGPLNGVLIAIAAVTAILFVRTERRATAPLVRLGLFHDRALSAALVMSLLVSAVVMTTLIVGPFYLSIALGLDMAIVGLVMTAGPLTVAVMGVPAGFLTERFGARLITTLGLIAVILGTALLALLPAKTGIPGYTAPLMITTCGYALFLTANNTAVMAGLPSDRRGVISGTLNLSRSLGLITGASLMGAVFALAAGSQDLAQLPPEQVAAAMRLTFAVACGLGFLALGAFCCAKSGRSNVL